jgi:hypothetical protein
MPQPVGTGKAAGWYKMNGSKNDGDSGGAPVTQSRAAQRTARMASALRANLLKRKQQKRDRAAQIKPAGDGQD